MGEKYNECEATGGERNEMRKARRVEKCKG